MELRNSENWISFLCEQSDSIWISIKPKESIVGKVCEAEKIIDFTLEWFLIKSRELVCKAKKAKTDKIIDAQSNQFSLK